MRAIRIGDWVRNKKSGTTGKVLLVAMPGNKECALVEFVRGGNRYVVPRNQLEIVNRNGEKPCK